MDRSRVKKLENAQSKLSWDARSMIPAGIVGKLVSGMGRDAFPVMEEMANVMLESKDQTPPLLSYLTESGDLEPHYYGTLKLGSASYRPDDALSFDKIDRMLKNGQVSFALEMKKAWLRSALRDKLSWDIQCADEKMQETVKGLVGRVMQRHSAEFMEALPYGVYFGEKIFDRQKSPYWGLEGNDDLIGYKKINPIHPKSIKEISYSKDGKHFNGFVQTGVLGDDINVRKELALVLPYNSRFRNLWGHSLLEQVYPYWAWYEIAFRSLMRYLERMGTPVTVCYAPARGQIRTPDGTAMGTMKYAFLVAGNVSKSNAIAIPGDIDPDTKQPLWRLDYLSDDKRGAQFVDAINLLGTAIVKSTIIGDRAIEQPAGGPGSYNTAQAHFAVTMLHNEHVLAEFLNNFNAHLIPQLVTYNGTQTTPPATMITEGLDPFEKDRLFALISIAGNQAGAEGLKKVDWEQIYKINNIPVLSEEDVKKIEQEGLEREKEHLKMQKEFATPALPKSPKPGLKPDAQKAVKNSADYLLYQLASGAQVPLILSNDQAQEMVDRFSDRPFVLFNPYHDELGRFAAKAGASIVTAKDKTVEWMKEHKKELIVAGVAAGVITAVAVGASVGGGVAVGKILPKMTLGTIGKVGGKVDIFSHGHEVPKIDLAAIEKTYNVVKDAVPDVNVERILFKSNMAMAAADVGAVTPGLISNMKIGALTMLNKMGARSLQGLARPDMRSIEIFKESAKFLDSTLTHEMIHLSPAMQSVIGSSLTRECATEAATWVVTGTKSISDYTIGAGKIFNKAIAVAGDGASKTDIINKIIELSGGTVQLEEDEKRLAVIAACHAILRGNETDADYEILLATLKKALKLEEDSVALFNPYHDSFGRFSTAIGAASTAGKIGTIVSIVGVGLMLGGTIGAVVAEKARFKKRKRNVDTYFTVKLGNKEYDISYGQAKVGGKNVAAVGSLGYGAGMLTRFGSMLAREYVEGKMVDEMFESLFGTSANDWTNQDWEDAFRRAAGSTTPSSAPWPPNATKQDFQKMYRDLAKNFHPDLSSAPDAAERMTEINEFYSGRDWQGMEDLWKKLEDADLTEEQILELLTILMILEDAVESGAQFIAFKTDEPVVPPLVVDDGAVIIDALTAKLILGIFKLIGEVGDKRKLEENVFLYNPYHDEFGKFTSKTGAVTTTALEMPKNYEGFWGGLSEAAQKIVTPPAEWLSRKNELLPKLARGGIELGTDLFFSRLAAGLVGAKAGVLGATAVQAVALALFGVAASPAALIVGGLVAGIGATLIVAEIFDQAQNKMFYAYLNRFSPKDNMHLMFSGRSKVKKAGKVYNWLQEIAFLPLDFLVLVGRGGANMGKKLPDIGDIAALAPWGTEFGQGILTPIIEAVKIGTKVSVGVAMKVLEEDILDDEREFYATLFVMAIGAATAEKEVVIVLPNIQGMSAIPGFRERDEGQLHLDRRGCTEYINAYAEGDLPNIGSIQYGNTTVYVDKTTFEGEKVIELFNPFHDEKGLFTTKEGASFTGRELSSLRDKAAKRIDGIPGDTEVIEFTSRAEARKVLGAYKGVASFKDGKIYITPEGAKYFKKYPDFKDHALVHEFIHTRTRSNGKRISIQTTQQAHFEEGTTELMAMGITGVPFAAYKRDVTNVARYAREQSGGDREAAWKLIGEMHKNNNKAGTAPKVYAQRGKWGDVEWMLEDMPKKLQEEPPWMEIWRESERSKWVDIYGFKEEDLEDVEEEEQEAEDAD